MGRIGLGVLLVFATAALYEAFRPPLAPTPWSLGSPPGECLALPWSTALHQAHAEVAACPCWCSSGRAATHRGQQWRATTTMSSIYRSRSRINYYEVLGIPPDATRETIKRAYHQKAKTLHPDLSRTVVRVWPDRRRSARRCTGPAHSPRLWLSDCGRSA